MPLFNLSVCVCVCVTFVVFTDCESCTRATSTNPGSMGAGEYGLTRGKCFVARRLELVALAGLLWISWCVFGGTGFFCLFFFLRTHTIYCKYEAASCLIYLSTSGGVRTGCHYLNSLCVCVCVCVTFVVFSDCERCTRPTSTNPGSMEAGEYGLTRGRAFSRAVSRWSRSPDCCVFSGVFSVWRNFIFFR